MSELRDIGYTGAIQSKFQSETTEKDGSTSSEIWEGTLDQIRLQKVLNINRGASKNNIQPKGDGAYTLQSFWAFDVDPENPHSDAGYVNTLELEINATQRSIFQSPRYRKWFADYTGNNVLMQHSPRANATLEIIGDLHRKYSSGQPARTVSDNLFHYKTIAGVDTGYQTLKECTEAELANKLANAKISGVAISLSAQETNAATNFFTELAYMGVTSFIEYDSVFRRTVTAGHPTAIQSTDTGSGMIWTTAELIAFEGLADEISNGYFALPPDVQWHKDKPRVMSAWGQKTQLSYSYVAIKTASALHYRKYGTALLIHTPTPSP